MVGNIKESSDDRDDEISDINVTPFIDVMLVLLIIFMVAAPLSTVDVKVELPGSTAKKQERPEKPLFLTLKSDLSLSLGNDSIAREALAFRLEQATEGNKETVIFLRADKEIGYGEFMKVVNVLRDAGYLKLALVGLEKTGADAGSEEIGVTQEPEAR